MRVHPSFVNSRGPKWQFPAAFALMIFVLIMALRKGPSQVVVATPTAPPVKKVAVVVAKASIEQGVSFDKAQLTMEERPQNTLPADAITSFDLLKGKVSAGLIPAGYPLARALLTDPAPPKTEEPKIAEPNPIDVMLHEIALRTVAVPITFGANAPERGARVALALSAQSGETVLILDEGWVSEAAGNRATLRVNPDKAIFLQSARKLGTLNFIEIPHEGPSPYAGNAMSDLAAIELALGLKAQVSEKPVGEKGEQPVQFGSYAWIKGTGERYGIDGNGKMFVVDQNGREIGPLLKDMK